MVCSLDSTKILIAGGSGSFMYSQKALLYDMLDFMSSKTIIKETDCKFNCAGRTERLSHGKFITFSANREVICYDQASNSLKKLHQFWELAQTETFLPKTLN